jgi:hypothetical protein
LRGQSLDPAWRTQAVLRLVHTHSAPAESFKDAVMRNRLSEERLGL